jgi:hypothetical protein
MDSVGRARASRRSRSAYDASNVRAYHALMARACTWALPLGLAIACALAGCFVVAPLPAGRERIVYEQLTSEKAGTVFAQELQQRYGPPHLSCQGGKLWLYGWSVGHGGFTGMVAPLGGDMTRLYYTFHVVFLWLDADGKLVRRESAPPERHTSEVPHAPMCVADGLCVRPRWVESFPSGNGQDSYVCLDGSCMDWGLAGESIVELHGETLECTARWGCNGARTCQ